MQMDSEHKCQDNKSLESKPFWPVIVKGVLTSEKNGVERLMLEDEGF